MTAGLCSTLTAKPFLSFHSPHHIPNPALLFSPLLHHRTVIGTQKRFNFTVSFLLKEKAQNLRIETASEEEGSDGIKDTQILIPAHVAEKLARKKSERTTYLVAAVMSSFGITSLAIMSVYCRFSWQMEVGMEFWARWAHRALWHASLWHLHESHHRPREGPFELNDVFAIINAVPAIALLSFGFFNKGLYPGLCYGAGLGITVFGMAYMFVHDGLVHKRFPVGSLADVPYFRRVAAAHQIHHSGELNGVPYGLFLGPDEVEEIGGLEKLEKEIRRRAKAHKTS